MASLEDKDYLANHPLGELYSRPYSIVPSPISCLHFALKYDDYEQTLSQLNLFLNQLQSGRDIGLEEALCELHLGHCDFRFERHTEFMALTFYAQKSEELYGMIGKDAFLDKIYAIEGQILSHVVVDVWREGEMPDEVVRRINGYEFGLIKAHIAKKRAIYSTSLKPHRDGKIHFIIEDAGLSKGQVGRYIQRFYELVDYAALSLYALASARKLSNSIMKLETELKEISSDMTKSLDHDQSAHLMHRLNLVSAKIEKNVSEYAYRFAASRAYSAIVHERINYLNEELIEGYQSTKGFMERRHAPAMRYIASVETSLERLSLRSRNIAALMRTRVDHALEAQNANLLESVSQQMKLQIRLQRMVEGLSVIAVSYYLVSLILYMLPAIGKLPFMPAVLQNMESKTLIGYIVPLVIVAVWFGTRHLYHKITQNGHAPH